MRRHPTWTSTAPAPDAAAGGSNAIALGSSTGALGDFAIAIGYNAKSNTGGSSNGLGNVVIGSNALVDNTGAGAIAIGRNAKVNNNGGDSAVTGAGSVAMGDGAAAYGNGSTAIGLGSYSGHSDAVALGNNARVLSLGSSVALGSGTLADEDGTISIGNKSSGYRHRLVNMDGGLSAYEAVNVNQLQPALTGLGAAFDANTGTVTGPTYTLVNGGTQTTVGGALSALDQAVSDALAASDPYLAVNSSGAAAAATGSDAIGLGSGARAGGDHAVAIGANAVADLPNTVSVGRLGGERKIVNAAAATLAATSTDVVIGSQLYDTNLQLSDLQDALTGSGLIDPVTGDTLAVTYQDAGKNVIVLGAGQAVTITNLAPAVQGNGAVNLTQMTGAIDALRGELGDVLPYVKVNSTGTDANAAGDDAVAIGSAAIASVDGSVALGVRARASVSHGVALGSDSLADTPLTVSVGSSASGLTRRVVNLQPGVGASDAVSVSQLQPMVTALGGGAAIDPVTGAVSGPTYTLTNGGVQTTLEGALGALDQAIGDSAGENPYLAINSTGGSAAAQGRDAIGLGNGASAIGNNSVALGANAIALQDNTVSVGAGGVKRKIVSVAAGDVSEGSSEAIVGAQLYATNQAIGVLQDALNGSGLIDPGTGASLAVTYSSVSKNMVFLGNQGTPVEVMNVGTGLAATDAVNVAQMTGAVNGLRSELSNNLAYVKVNATGVGANAGGNDSVAIGSSANTTAAYGVAIGTGARVQAAYSVALGWNSVANVQRTVSVGNPGNERRIVNVADGDISAGSTDAVTGGQLFDALGAMRASRLGVLDVTAPLYAIEGVEGDNTASLNGADPVANTALAFGVKSLASGGDTASFGLNCIAQSDNAVAIGSSATTGADTPYTVAIGADATTTGTQAIAMGAHVQANADNAVAVGNNNTWALGVSSIAIGDSAKDRGISGVAIGKTATVLAGATSCVAIGTSTSVAANLSDAIALGTSARVLAGANGGVALGQGAVANRGTAVSLGGTTGTTTITRQIINLSAGTSGTDAVNVTQLLGVTTALGGGAGIGADGSVLPPAYTVGGSSYADVGAALNAVANLTDPNAVSYDDAAKGTVTLDGSSGTLLTNLSAGAVSSTSTDAINGSQLFGTAQSVATGLGSGAAVNPDGTVAAPLYVIGSSTANNVGTALTNLYSAVEGQLADAGLIDPSSGQAIAAVTYDSASQTLVSLGGTSATNPVRVTNAAAGTLSASSSDVVNGAQLFATNQTLSDLATAVDNSGIIDPVTGAPLAVIYASDAKTDINLGNAGTPVKITNAAAATLAAGSTDTVNGSQLFATNQALGNLATAVDNSGIIDPATGTPLAVTYADTSRQSIDLGTAGIPVTVSNVAAGDVSTTSTDAVNGAQLNQTNLAVTQLADALDNAVTYSDASKTDVALGTGGAPVTISNLAPGSLSSASEEAVNGAQLYATNEAIGDLADALDNSGLIDPATGESLAVTYTDAMKSAVTLGAVGTPVTVSNVQAAVLSSQSMDAVNGAQLFATDAMLTELKDALDNGGVLDPTTGEALAVTYADAAKTDIALGTAGMPATITNLQAGALTGTSTDAVNGAQLFATNQAVSDLADTLDNSGLIDPTTGTSLAVTYDDSDKDGVTLGGSGATAAVPLHNLATGTADTDGVNVAQLTSGLSDLKDELTNGAITLKYIKVSSTGTQANANGTDAVSIGAGASSTAANAVAIGSRSRASGNNAVAIGYNSIASDSNVVSVGYPGGERKIINVDNGDVSADSTDAVNGSQLFAVRQAVESLAVARGKNGVHDVVDPLAAIEGRSGNNIASLNGGDANETTAAAIGVFSLASGANAIAMGLRNVAGSDYSVALGHMAQTGADHEYSVAVGSDVHTGAARAVALGTRVQANGEHALAMGSNETWATGRSSIALGEGVKVRAQNGIAMGRAATVAANASDALALGAQASVVAGAIGAVALGHGAVADRGNAISIGGGTVGARQIIHVAAGTEDDDAVNVKQLRDVVASLMAEIQMLRSQLGTRPSAQ